MNHALRFSLAELQLQVGNQSEAIQQAERASRLSPENSHYKSFLQKIPH